jgi:hypothetical protein
MRGSGGRMRFEIFENNLHESICILFRTECPKKSIIANLRT